MEHLKRVYVAGQPLRIRHAEAGDTAGGRSGPRANVAARAPGPRSPGPRGPRPPHGGKPHGSGPRKPFKPR
jgi:ATP-dependent RNA helicase DeaD